MFVTRMSRPLSLVLLCILQIVYAAVINPYVETKTDIQTSTTTKPPPPDTARSHGLFFFYHHSSLEHLLLLISHPDCFVMPLFDKDVEDIQHPQTLKLMEEHMMSQIGQHLLVKWSYDDYEVRDKPWSDGCKNRNGTIYRVYRL